jgi:hypothetical protein
MTDSQVLGDEHISEVNTLINGEYTVVAALRIEQLSDEANLERSSKGATAKNAKLHAVKSGVHKLLDVARNTYKENMEDIRDCKDRSGSQLTKVCEQANRAFPTGRGLRVRTICSQLRTRIFGIRL